MSPPLPPTLRTATPAEGLVLARQLAVQIQATQPGPVTMAGHLRPGAAAPSVEAVAAIYFHAISLANAGWVRPA